MRALDPRLKLGLAFILGPSLWIVPPFTVLICGLSLLCILLPLAVIQPVGRKMVRTMFFFVLFWVGMKSVLDAISGMPFLQIAVDCGVLGLRLSSLLLLGLTLALSASARALGLAVAWGVAPFVGRERAWKLALSLALMIHFLPMCLDAMTQVKVSLDRRCPTIGAFQRLRIIPQASIRYLGQKTWNQTLAVAGRGLENGDAWIPDFSWSFHDSLWGMLALGVLAVSFLF